METTHFTNHISAITLNRSYLLNEELDTLLLFLEKERADRELTRQGICSQCEELGKKLLKDALENTICENCLGTNYEEGHYDKMD